jgi:hypothetical protein
MPEAIEHIRVLADRIGPRPATTDAEAEAADYIEGVFRDRGLEVERQEFDCPRTYSWAYVSYHALTIGAAVLSGWLAWPAFVIALLSAVLLWGDLSTRFGLSRFMPKGPSQNVIARHVPRVRRGERMRKVVVVAHYDSARSSLAFSPGLVKSFSTTFGLMKWLTTAVPLVILVGALPWTEAWRPWTWYAALATSAYLLVPLLINLHREFLMKAVDGANDNASGVATMLAVMQATVPEPDERATHPIARRSMDETIEDDDEALEYRPMADGTGAPRAKEVLGEFGDLSWDETTERRPAPAAAPPEPEEEDDRLWDEEQDEGQERLDLGVEMADGASEEESAEPHERRGLRDWLGLGKGFDVRAEGKNIGSWGNFGSDDDEDEFGFKAGDAGGEVQVDDIAAQIRRRVTDGVDRELSEKEIWFVATGAEESGTWGMQEFLTAHGEELKDALIINIDNVGSGAVHWVTEEGMARRHHCDRRLASTARRVAAEENLPVRGRAYRGLSTDATPALARRYRAMSVMAFDINGRLPNWHWNTDTVENVSQETVDTAVKFVTGLLRAL